MLDVLKTTTAKVKKTLKYLEKYTSVQKVKEQNIYILMYIFKNST